MTRYDRGDPPSEIVPLFEEGLQLARRDGAVATIGWIANEPQLRDGGSRAARRQPRARRRRRIDASLRAGDDERVAQAREALIWGHLLRGDRDRRPPMDGLRSPGRRTGPLEGRGGRPSSRRSSTGRTTRRRPTGASRRLLRRSLAGGTGLHGGRARGRADGASTRRREGLARATTAYPRRSTAGSSGPISIIRRRWFAGLVSDPDGSDVEAAASELESVGYRLLAAYAFADAALLAARVGRASNAEQRAMAIAVEIGLYPSLGPLPETRWLAPQPTMRG